MNANVHCLLSDMKADNTKGEYPDPKLIRRWYRLDSNTIPAVYRLQKIRYDQVDMTGRRHFVTVLSSCVCLLL